MLWLARGLEQAPADALDLQYLARAGLTGASSELLALRTVLPHPNRIDFVEVSPDATTILTGCHDGTVRLWNATNGRAVGAARTFEGSLRAAVFSPLGPKVMTVLFGGNKARIWYAATGQAVGKDMPHPAPVQRAVFSPDGTRLATFCQDRKVRLWDTATGEPIGEPMLSSENVPTEIVFSPNGGTLATVALFARQVRLWDASTGRLLHTLAPQPISSRILVDFSADGKRLLTRGQETRVWNLALANVKPVGPVLKQVTGQQFLPFAVLRPDGQAFLTDTGEPDTLQLWDTAGGQPIGAPIAHPGGLQAVAFSPDGRTLLTAARDGSARLWDGHTGQPIGLPWSHPDRIEKARFSPNGRSILTVCGDNRLRVWDQPTGRLLQAPLLHADPVHLVAFSRDGKRIITGSGRSTYPFRGEAQLWDLATGRAIGPRLSHRLTATTARFAPDGQTVMTGCEDDGTSHLWDIQTGKPVGPLEFIAYTNIPCIGGPDGKTALGFIGVDGRPLRLQMWNMATGQPAGEPLESTGGSIIPLALSPDGKTLLGMTNGEALLWNVSTGKPVGRLSFTGQPGFTQGPARIQAAFSANGRIVTTDPSNRRVYVWHDDIHSPAGVHPLVNALPHDGPISHLLFRRDGKVLLVAGGRTARLWDFATGTGPNLLGQPLQHDAPIRAVAFSPDSQTILTGSDDRTARVWNARTGQPLGPPLVHQGAVLSVAFDPTGRLLLTASADHMARLWEAPAPVEGNVDRLVSWVALSTGQQLSGENTFQVLDGRTWEELHQELEKQGGPPRTATDGGRFGFGWHQRLAAENLEAGHWFAARWHLDRLIEVQPDNWQSYAQRARAHYQLGERVEAAADCRRAIEKGPDEPVRDWFSRQSPLQDSGITWETAAWYLDQLLPVRPDSGPAHVLRTRARLELGQKEEAAADFFHAVALGPRVTVLKLFRAYADEYAKRDQWDKAVWFLDRLSKEERGDAVLHWQTATAHARLGQFEEAVQEYTLAEEQYSTASAFSSRRSHAIVALHLGDSETYRKAVGDVLHYVAHGSVALRSGQPRPPQWQPSGMVRVAAWIAVLAPDGLAGAEALVQHLEAIQPRESSDPFASLILGAALYRTGRAKDALPYLQKAIQLEGEEEDPATWLFVALAQHRLGNTGEAEKALARATQMLDRSADVPLLVGRYALSNQLEGLGVNLVRREAEVLIKGTPDTSNVQLLLSYARANFRVKDWDRAAAEFSRAIERGDKNWRTWANRAQCLAELRQWDRAAADCTRALELQPHDLGLLVLRLSLLCAAEPAHPGNCRLRRDREAAPGESGCPAYGPRRSSDGRRTPRGAGRGLPRHRSHPARPRPSIRRGRHPGPASRSLARPGGPVVRGRRRNSRLPAAGSDGCTRNPPDQRPGPGDT